MTPVEEDRDSVDFQLPSSVPVPSESTWHLGSFSVTSEAVLFLFIHLALLSVLAVGLYNLTVGDMQTRLIWGPIVSGAFFVIIPGPRAPKKNNGYTPNQFIATESAAT